VVIQTAIASPYLRGIRFPAEIPLNPLYWLKMNPGTNTIFVWSYTANLIPEKVNCPPPSLIQLGFEVAWLGITNGSIWVAPYGSTLPQEWYRKKYPLINLSIHYNYQVLKLEKRHYCSEKTTNVNNYNTQVVTINIGNINGMLSVIGSPQFCCSTVVYWYTGGDISKTMLQMHFGTFHWHPYYNIISSRTAPRKCVVSS